MQYKKIPIKIEIELNNMELHYLFIFCRYLSWHLWTGCLYK